MTAEAVSPTPPTTCPAWCTHHARFEPPGSHQGDAWEALGMEVSIEQDADGTVRIGVDNGPRESVTLTPTQAHELGLQLVRAADRVRRAREAQR